VQPDKLVLNNYEGKKLSSLLFTPSSEVQGVVIAAHGFRGAKENSNRICSLAAKLVPLGLVVLAFDFAGSGESEGDFADLTLTGQSRDLQAVMDWVEAQGWSPIILLGRSFGGSTVLIRAAQDERARGIILWSTPVFLQETFSTTMAEEYHQLEMGKPVIIRDDWGEFRLNPSFVSDINRQDMDQHLKSVSGRPVLIIHGTADEIVKPRNAEYIYNKVGSRAELHLIEGSDHRFVDSTAIREDLTVSWLQRTFLSDESR
jgi:alpha/beta superfamily hydrolase